MNLTIYEGKSIIFRNAVSLCVHVGNNVVMRSNLPVVSVLLFLRRFDVAKSVQSSLPCR
jgi:hypothetical protein